MLHQYTSANLCRFSWLISANTEQPINDTVDGLFRLGIQRNRHFIRLKLILFETVEPEK
jgi:hypothetical protein